MTHTSARTEHAAGIETLPPEFGLRGNVAIVTGGGGSLGRAIATALAEAGAAVVVSDVRSGAAEAVAEQIAAAGRTALAIDCDVSREGDVKRLVADAVGKFGRLDVMVANAGVFQVWASPEDNSVEEWRRVLDTNLSGVMLSCLEAGRQMKRQGSGSIVATSSIVGHAGLKGNFSYTVSKHGVIGIVRNLAVEWAEHGIRVNAVCPGFVTRDVEPLKDDPVVSEMIVSRTPLGRWGEPRDIALAVLYLASPAAKYVTGISLPVDGGWLAL